MILRADFFKDKQNRQSFIQTHQEKQKEDLNRIRNKRDVAINTTEIQKIVRNYYGQLYINLE